MTAADWDMKMLALEKGRVASADAYIQLYLHLFDRDLWFPSNSWQTPNSTQTGSFQATTP